MLAPLLVSPQKESWVIPQKERGRKRTQVKETKTEEELIEQMQVEKRLGKATDDTSDESEEEGDLFNPGRLGWSDSPDLIAWRFLDYPEEEEGGLEGEHDGEVSDGEEGDKDEDEPWRETAWLRISSERLDLPQDNCRSPALAVLRTPSYLRMSTTTSPSLRRSLSMVDLSTTPIPDMPSLVENTAELGVGILKDFRDFQDLNSSCSWCGELLEGLEKEGREGGGREEQGWSEEEEDSYEERTRDKERGSD